MRHTASKAQASVLEYISSFPTPASHASRLCSASLGSPALTHTQLTRVTRVVPATTAAPCRTQPVDDSDSWRNPTNLGGFRGSHFKTMPTKTKKTVVNVLSFIFVPRKSEAGPSGPPK